MNDSTPKKALDEVKAQRRRERLKAFFIPWIYLGSIVASVGLIMALIRSCSERFPRLP